MVEQFHKFAVVLWMSAVMYSIRDLERFSGIKAHTIRMWEQRYEFLLPTRTDTNLRRYSDADLKKLLNAATLSRMGYKISRIVAMTADEVSELVSSEVQNENHQVHQLNILKIAMLNFDENLFMSAVNAHVETNGIEKTVLELLGPFLVQIGILWQTNAICVAHEHFVSNLLRQFLCKSIADEPAADSTLEPFVLFLPDDEQHELGLLFLHLLLKRRGLNSIYLGQAVPVSDLPKIESKFASPHFVAYLIEKDSTKVYTLLKNLSIQQSFDLQQKMSIIWTFAAENDQKRFKNINIYQNTLSFLEKLSALVV